VARWSVALKEPPAPRDGPAILLSDRDALRLLFLLALSNLIGLRLVGRVVRILKAFVGPPSVFPSSTTWLMIMGLVAAETSTGGLRWRSMLGRYRVLPMKGKRSTRPIARQTCRS
jgi:hypothetical protein